MAATLLGYFTTMVATLVALMVLLNNVLSSGVTERVHHQPYPYPAVAQVSVPDNKRAATDKQTDPSEPVIAAKASVPSRTAAVASVRLATAKQSLPDRNRRQKSALNQSHKEDAARRQQDQEYSLALGYAQEPYQEPQRQAGGPLFDLFGQRRF